MQDVIIVTCVLSVIFAASFFVMWLIYRKKEIKEFLSKATDNSIEVIFILILAILVLILNKF